MPTGAERLFDLVQVADPAHAVLRLYRTHQLPIVWYVRRGAAPPIEPSWVAPTTSPLELKASEGARSFV